MKKILLLTSFLISFLTVFAQYPVITRSTGSNTPNDKRLLVELNMYLPSYTDTVQANVAANLGIDSCGAQIFLYSTNTMWYRACNPKRWVEMASAGGTITSISTGNLAPLFTAAITNPTSTPALAFTLSNATAFTVFGRATGTGVPSYLSLDTTFISNFYLKVRASLSTVAVTGSYNDLSNKPTIPAQFNPTIGYGLIQLGTYPNIQTLVDSTTLSLYYLRRKDSTIYYPYASNPKNYLTTTSGWSVLGNAGTVDGTNFIGTTDNIPFNIRVNNERAGKLTTTGNTFYGYHAGHLGLFVTSVGFDALNVNTGNFNTAFGYENLKIVSTGTSNVSSGYRGMVALTTGINNVGIGSEVGLNLISGDENTIIGHRTGLGITTGDYNTIIGANVSGLSASLSNNIILADGQGNIRLQFNSTALNFSVQANTIDTTTYKPLVQDASGNVRKATYWFGSGGAGSGTVTSFAFVDANGFTGVVTNSTSTPALTLSLQNAVADGATKGQAAFVSADFNAAAGVISIDYSNGQAATGAQDGFLQSADWTTFNNKAPSTRLINTTSPLTGGGDLSADRTIAINDAGADGATKGAAAFTAADFNAASGVVSLDYANGQAATSGQDGFLQSTDWVTFNNKVASSRTLTAGTGLTGGGDLSADRTFALANTAVTPGSYTNADITIDAQGRITAASSGIGGAADTVNVAWPLYVAFGTEDTLKINQATTTDSGYLTNTDWNTFNDKLPSLLNSAQIFVGNASNVATGRTMNGDATISNTGVFTISDASVEINDINATGTADNTTFLRGDGVWAVPPGSGGSGESNTASNLGGGLANFDSKSVVDLRFNSFTALDFNLASNLISIDYANGQAATSGQDGFLQSGDWTTFNNKQAAISETDNNLTFAANVLGTNKAPQTLTDGATITWNMQNGFNAKVTLGGNRTLSVTNAQAGDYGTLEVIQDGTGSRTLAVTDGAVTLSTAAGSTTFITFYYNGTNFAWRDGSSGSGAGSVTNFSAGDLSPLFTTSEATTTTTPALTFTLSNAGANTYFGNATGSSAAPSFTAAGSLTKTDDTNITLTLGGSPTTSLLASTSLTLGWTGTLSLARGGTAAALSDPGADRIMFWDESANAVTWLTVGTNLTITGTTIDASGGGGGEANTASNLGGGLANYSTKVGVDLQFNSFNASHFDLASNVISIDATLVSTWNGKQNAISLTTTGSSGVATFDGTTLNIPNYTSGTSQWTTVGSDIYYNTGNVLIGGTSGFTGKLFVKGASSSIGLYLEPTDNTHLQFLMNSASAAVTRHWMKGSGDASFALGAGEVGIGIAANPVNGAKLYVAGTSDVSAGAFFKGFTDADVGFGVNNATGSSNRHLFYSNGYARLSMGAGGVSIRTSADATAWLHLGAGTATASTAPLKLTTGTALTTPEDGALEYHSSHLYFTIGSTRYQLDQQGGVTDHGALTGLSDDDHTQYALLAGRSGGQTQIGGTASANDYTVTSTSHATKGNLIFGTNAKMNFDEQSIALRLGTSTAIAGYQLQVNGSAIFGSGATNATLALRNSNNTSGSSTISLEMNNGTILGQLIGYDASYSGTVAGIPLASMMRFAAVYPGTLMLGTNTTAIYMTSNSSTIGFMMDGSATNKIGIGGVTSPTARMHFPAGLAAASGAPIKLTTGTALTTPEDGAMEYHSSHLYFTIGSTRYQLDQQGGGSGTVTDFIFTDGNGFDGTVTNSTTTPTLSLTTTVSNTQVLYSNSGALAGAAGFVFNGTSTVTFGVAGTSKGTLILSGNTSGAVTIMPAAAAGTWSLTLPTDDGTSGQVLTIDGTGVTSWSSITTSITGTVGQVLVNGTSGSAQTGAITLTLPQNIRTTDNVQFNSINVASVTASDFIQTGGFKPGYRAESATYTAVTTDYTIDCDGTFTVDLPSAVGIAGTIFVIKNSGTGTITIDPSGVQQIDGASTKTISVQYSGYMIQSTGAAWIIISSF